MAIELRGIGWLRRCVSPRTKQAQEVGIAAMLPPDEPIYAFSQNEMWCFGAAEDAFEGADLAAGDIHLFDSQYRFVEWKSRGFGYGGSVDYYVDGGDHSKDVFFMRLRIIEMLLNRDIPHLTSDALFTADIETLLTLAKEACLGR
jgi:hypothetical protein